MLITLYREKSQKSTLFLALCTGFLMTAGALVAAPTAANTRNAACLAFELAPTDTNAEACFGIPY